MVARRLCYFGLAILAVTAWLLVADLQGWLPPGVASAWTWPLIRAAAACFGGGIALMIASPLLRELRRGHCVRCGKRIERGQVYCLDHLQQTLNEYRDQTRAKVLGEKGSRA